MLDSENLLIVSTHSIEGRNIFAKYRDSLGKVDLVECHAVSHCDFAHLKIVAFHSGHVMFINKLEVRSNNSSLHRLNENTRSELLGL